MGVHCSYEEVVSTKKLQSIWDGLLSGCKLMVQTACGGERHRGERQDCWETTSEDEEDLGRNKIEHHRPSRDWFSASDLWWANSRNDCGQSGLDYGRLWWLDRAWVWRECKRIFSFAWYKALILTQSLKFKRIIMILCKELWLKSWQRKINGSLKLSLGKSVS